MTVQYGDLSVSTLAGATTLYRRIEGAARYVCGIAGRSFAEQRDWNRCYERAVADAIATVNSPVRLDRDRHAAQVRQGRAPTWSDRPGGRRGPRRARGGALRHQSWTGELGRRLGDPTGIGAGAPMADR